MGPIPRASKWDLWLAWSEKSLLHWSILSKGKKAKMHFQASFANYQKLLIMINCWISVKYISLIVTVSEDNNHIFRSNPKTPKFSHFSPFSHKHFSSNSSRIRHFFCFFLYDSSFAGCIEDLLQQKFGETWRNSQLSKLHSSMASGKFFMIMHGWAANSSSFTSYSIILHLFSRFGSKQARISHCHFKKVKFRTH